MGARGERTFKAGAREVTVLFTNRALASAETRLGKSALAIANGMKDGALMLNDLAVLLQVGMEAARVDVRAGGNQVSLDAAYAVIDELGLLPTAVHVIGAVGAVLQYKGDEPAAGEPDPNA